MVNRYREGRIQHTRGGVLTVAADSAVERYRIVMDQYLLHRGLSAAFELVRAANGYVDEQAPWALAKAERGIAGPEALDHVLSELMSALATLSTLFAPFMPAKAEAMWAVLGGVGSPPGLDNLKKELRDLTAVSPGEVLFPRPN